MFRANSISVRDLARLIFRQGDLYSRTPGRTVTAEEGIRVQKEAQKTRVVEIPGYVREHRIIHVAEMISASGEQICLQVSGRMDGYAEREEDLFIEEFKACGHLPDNPDPIDWGQLYIYAGLIAKELSTERGEIMAQLVYVQADSNEEKIFAQRFNMDDLISGVDWVMTLYSVAWQTQERHQTARQRWSDDLEFPMPSFRPGQKSLARRVYQAIQSGSDLLIEAPTGSGKSLAVLFPAIKAMAPAERLFFLTGRNAGREAALNALERIDPEASELRVVDITAKEKICFVEGMPCDPEICEYAQGYYDKLADALAAGLRSMRCDRTRIETLAREHAVCPFEFSLDLALCADVVIGDYNYIYDPVVRLQRFANDDDMHLLCDEAHQLVPRVRDSLSVEMNRAEVKAALKDRESTLESRLKSLDRALMKYRRGLEDGEHRLEAIDSVDRAAQRFVERVAELDFDISTSDAIRRVYFSCLRWVRSEDWRNLGTFYSRIKVEKRQVSVGYVCIDPAPYIAKVSSEFASSIRFSATLSPLALTARMQGFAEAATERAQNPFTSGQLSAFVVPDIPTYYQQRLRSLDALCGLIGSIYDSRPGRYLVAMPSYEYLFQVEGRLDHTAPLHVQKPGSSQADLELLIRSLGEEGGILLAVMGGSLSESVDFLGARLDGVVVVGLGLPPPSLTRDLQAAHFDEEAGVGQLVAYTQPALTKILQTAGRLIRDTRDRGIICLVDPRFRAPAIQQFFPEHWQIRAVRSEKVSEHVRQFWSTQSL